MLKRIENELKQGDFMAIATLIKKQNSPVEIIIKTKSEADYWLAC